MQTELDCVYFSAIVATTNVSRTSSGIVRPALPVVVKRSFMTRAVLRFWVMVKP